MRKPLTSHIAVLAGGVLSTCLLCGCPLVEDLLSCLVFGPPPVDVCAAADRLEIDGQHFVLECHLNRDFMPISPPGGKPLTALIRLIEVDHLEINPGIDMTYLWVLKGCDVWETEFSDAERPPQPPYRIERVAGDGPKWCPSISVDVVVNVVDGAGNSYLIRSRDVPIGFTL